MTSEQPTIRMNDEERTYVVLRIVALAIGSGLYLASYIPKEMTLQRELSLWAFILSAVGTIIVVVGVFRGRQRVARLMLWVLPLDLVSLAVFTWVLAPYDANFGVCMVLIALYAVTVSHRAAILASIAIATAYAVGHAFAPAGTLSGFWLIGSGTFALALLGIIVSNAIRTQRERERQVEFAIEDREQVNEQLARRVGELQAVAEITEVIHSSLDFDDVGTLVLEIISKVIDFPALAIFVLDKEKSETLFSASVGVPHDESIRAGGAPGLGEIEAHLTCLRVFDHGSTMVLFCSTAEDMEGLAEEDRIVIYALASELVVAVENSRLYKLTRRLAVTDELTGMSNYRYLQQRLDEEVTRAKRYGKHLSFLMMDADDFKGYNDRYGHIAGDLALAEFGGVLASIVREVDVVARYGGEEFAIVLPETDAAGAYVVAEKIREAIASHLFPDADGVRCCTLTVSIGVATYPTYAYDKEALLREADDALYRAKNGGRNRVCAPSRSPDPETIPGD